MFYKLLGMLVWNGGKLFLRRKYGSASLRTPLLAAAGVAAGAGVLAVALKRRGASSA